jgi:hypothetical protein
MAVATSMTAMIDAMTACQEKGKESKILRAHNIRQKSICERLIGVKEGLWQAWMS